MHAKPDLAGHGNDHQGDHQDEAAGVPVCIEPGVVRRRQPSGGYSLLAYVNGTSVVSAILADTGSKLQYDGKACKLKKAPK